MSEFSLGSSITAKTLYDQQSGDRQGVLDTGRKMAELTIASVLPPDGYKGGEDLPGNNQSNGARYVNNLASILMFMAFPPGQPICRMEAVEYELQAQVDEDPELWAKTQLALSRLELAHRKRLATTTLATAYTGYMKLLLVAGNALWKHIKLNAPTFHRPDTYVVIRSSDGHPLVTIHKEVISIQSLDEDTRDEVLQNVSEEVRKVYAEKEWEATVEIYSVCKLKVSADGEPSWLYWQEHEGKLLADTEVETDVDVPPMWPGWLIPVFGSNWGRSYCEEYRGDLYSLEASGSALNDGAAIASLSLIGIKPGSSTSIKQFREARNLSVIPGDFDSDVTVFRAEKGADFNFVLNREETIARRLAAAFLLQVGIQRDAERVTKEEVVRIGTELDKALGGLYTQIAQGNQRYIIIRAMKLHEAESAKLPRLPKGLVEVQVVTGVDSLGNTSEYQNLKDWATDVSQAFPKTWESNINGNDFALRTAAAKGIKPDGLIKKPEQVAEEQAAAQQQSMMQGVVEKGVGPAVTGLASMMQQQQQAPQQEGNGP